MYLQPFSCSAIQPFPAAIQFCLIFLIAIEIAICTVKPLKDVHLVFKRKSKLLFIISEQLRLLTQIPNCNQNYYLSGQGNQNCWPRFLNAIKIAIYPIKAIKIDEILYFFVAIKIAWKRDDLWQIQNCR